MARATTAGEAVADGGTVGTAPAVCGEATVGVAGCGVLICGAMGWIAAGSCTCVGAWEGATGTGIGFVMGAVFAMGAGFAMGTCGGTGGEIWG